MADLNNLKISSFKNTKSTEIERGDSIKTVGQVLEYFKRGFYKSSVDVIRAGDKDMKRHLPTFAFHGSFKNFRKKKDFCEATGLIILDIDNVDRDLIQDIKEEIIENDNHVFAVMTSPSGNGIKILYYILPDLVNTDTYRQIGKQLADNYSEYGEVDYLSITDCLIATYDPQLIINIDAEPGLVFIKEIAKSDVKLEPLDKSKKLWEDPEDFFDTVLATDIAEKTNNNFHFIQVSILDLAKFGFYHPKEDLSFIIDYAESYFNKSQKNKDRFHEVVQLAKNYPQQQWPYRYTSIRDDFEESYNDYSKPVEDESLTLDVEVDSSSSNEEEMDGLIDYSTLFKSVLETIKEGDRVGREISYKDFADIFRFKGVGILTITGIPSHGKTEFADACTLDLARLYGEETLVAGFEQTSAEHIGKQMRRLIGTNIACPSYINNPKNAGEIKKAYDFVTSKIKHINVFKTGGDINKILKIAASEVERSRENGGNPRYLLLDPFNMLSIKGRYSGHEKIEEILRRILHFSHQMDIFVILIAHPFKMKIDEKTKAYVIPDFYSVKGSSAFFEMSYHGLVVYRTGYNANDRVIVRVLKVKQNNLGEQGEEVYFTYNKSSGRYIPIDEEGYEQQGTHIDKDWLEKAIEGNLKDKK